MNIKLAFVKKYAENLPTWLISTVALFGAAIFAFSDIAHEVIGEKEKTIDDKILGFLSAHVIRMPLTKYMECVTYMGSAPFLQTGYCALILVYLTQKNYKRSLEVLVIGVSGLLINLAMKFSFHRLRPQHPVIAPLKSFSFPSGHATSGFIFYGLLVYLVWKTTLPMPYKVAAGSALISLSLLIGFSRVYLRLHYPSDVAAGLCIGFAWLLVAITLMERLKKKAKIEAVKEEAQKLV